MDKQVSVAEKHQAELEKRSHLTVSRPFMLEQVHHSPLPPQDWSSGGAGQLSPTPASLDSRDKETGNGPFACQIAETGFQHTYARASDPEASSLPLTTGLPPQEAHLSDLPDNLKQLISQAITRALQLDYTSSALPHWSRNLLLACNRFHSLLTCTSSKATLLAIPQIVRIHSWGLSPREI